jgi:hypothetical protein
VVGRNGQKRLDQLIDAVARGERRLSSISDPKLREAVRLALNLHQDAPVAPDAYAKRRMRARVMAGLEPHHPTLLDNAWTALELLARPAPYIVRGVAVASVLVCMGMGAIVASADTLPDDVFYPVKIATEQVRLALADAPGDRAGVELSIASHRLSEAERLASTGRTSDALVASALYSQHIASAAAELAPQDDGSDLGAQLETSFKAQRDRAQALAVTLASDVKSSRGAQILALIATPTYAPGQSKIEQVAVTAASVAQQLSAAADLAAAENAGIATPPPSGTAARSPSAPVTVVTSPSAKATASATATVTVKPSATSSAAASSPTSSIGQTSGASSAPSASGSTTSAAPASAPASAGTTTTTTTNTTATTTTTTTVGSAASNTTVSDGRARDAATAVRDAADKAKAAADKVKEKESNKAKGR